MKTATASLKSVSPYSQGKYIQTPKPDKLTHADFEKQVWSERCHTDNDGEIFIPPMAFKNCLQEAAKYLGAAMQIPGEGQTRYTKHFEAGILVVEPVFIGYNIKDIEQYGVWRHVPGNGKQGGTTRVEKRFPTFPSWSADVEFLVFDEKVTNEIFARVLEGAGQFIGVGVFRPRNRGYFGRFDVVKIKWD